MDEVQRSSECKIRVNFTGQETRYLTKVQLLEYLERRFGTDKTYGITVSPPT